MSKYILIRGGFNPYREVKEYKSKRAVEKENEECEVILATKESLLAELEALLQQEHIYGCDSTSCNINSAFENGFMNHAVDIFADSGAASDEFLNLYGEYANKFKNWTKLVMKESTRMCDDIDHTTCPDCNAVHWSDELVEGEQWSCDRCGSKFIVKLETYD